MWRSVPTTFPVKSTLAKRWTSSVAPTDALPHYEQAVAVEPDYPWGLAALAYALADRGETESAIMYYQRSLANDPEYGDARIELAKLLALLGRWEESAEQYQYFVARHPQDTEARLHFVDVLLRQGRDEDAAKSLEAGRNRSPNSIELHVRLARLRSASADEQLRNPAQALALARRAAKLIDIQSLMRQLQSQNRNLNPLAAQVLDVLAMAYAANGSYDLAMKTAALAMRAAELSGQLALRKQIASRLDLYRQQMPYRDAANALWPVSRPSHGRRPKVSRTFC